MERKFLLIIMFLFTAAFCISGFDMSGLFNNEYANSMPDTATNLQIHTFTNYYPVDSDILMFLYARRGNGVTDTMYSGTGFVKVFEELRDSSFTAFLFGPEDFYPIINNGESFFYFSNSDTELVSIRIEDSLNIIKPSFHTNIQFRLKSDTATQLAGIDDTLMTIDMPLQLFIRFEDDSERIFFDYAPIMSDSTMKVTVVSNEDSTVTLSSLGSTSHSEIYPMLVNGGYIVQIASSIVRDFDIIFEPLLTSPPLNADTFHFVCLPQSESPLLMTFSFTGYNQTIGKEKGLIMLNMGDNGPISSNNSSILNGELYDLTGKGGILSPLSAVTMTSGIAQYAINCDSVNECLVLKTEESGLPDLVNYTPFVTVKFLPLGEAVMSKAIVQAIAEIGDTITGKLYISDAYETVDSSYNGYAEFDVNINDYSILDPIIPVYDDYIPIINGYGDFRIYYPYAGSTSVTYLDGEKGGFTDAYFSANGFDGEEISIIWMYATDSGCDRFEMYEDEVIYAVGNKAIITVAAMSGDSISRNYNNYADISLSGTAVSEIDSVYLGSDGIGLFSVIDTSSGAVYITVSDSIYSVTDTIYFSDSDEAAFIVCAGPDTSLMNEDYDITFFAMTTDFRNDTMYNGTMTLMINDDKGDTSSLSLSHNPDAVSIVKGKAIVTFSNSDAERISFDGYSVSGSDTILVEAKELIAQYLFYVDEKTVINEIEDTLFVHIADADSIIESYNTVIDSIYVEEEFDNTSVSITSTYNPITVNNGTGFIAISDTESENVKIYAEYDDTLINGNNIYRMIFDLSSLTGIKNRSLIPEVSYLESSILNRDFVPVKFGIAKDSYANLSIYDKTGRMIKNLYKDYLSRGHYMVKWNGNDSNNNSVPNGIYFMILNIDNDILSKKIIITR